MSIARIFTDSFSIPLGRWAYRIPVRLHLLVAFIFLYFLMNLQPYLRVLEFESTGVLGAFNVFWLSAFLTAVAYGFIYLHELGHAIAALRNRIPVPMIMLHPLGGYAQMGLPYGSPNQEIVVAAAGPLVNGFFAALIHLLSQLDLIPQISSIPGWFYMNHFLSFCFWVNVTLLINLLPIFPFDGANVLRAFLSFSGNPNKATHRTAIVGFVLLAGIVIGAGFMFYNGVNILGFTGWMMVILCALACYSAILTARHSAIYDASAESFAPDPWAQSTYGDGYSYSSPNYDEKGGGSEPGFWEKRKQKKAEEAEQQKRVAEEEMRKQLDDILMKIKREGMDSLSRAEKKMLQQASEHFKDKGGARS